MKKRLLCFTTKQPQYYLFFGVNFHNQIYMPSVNTENRRVKIIDTFTYIHWYKVPDLIGNSKSLHYFINNASKFLLYSVFSAVNSALFF